MFTVTINYVDVQFGEHTQSAANCIPPAEVALNLAVGDFERNGEIGGLGVEQGKRERVFEYDCVKTAKKNINVIFEDNVRSKHGFALLRTLLCIYFFKLQLRCVLLYNVQYLNVPIGDFV